MQSKVFSSFKFYATFFLFQFMLFSCQQHSKQNYLEKGLEGYLKKRKVYQQFISSYAVEEIAFFETPENPEFVLKLDKNITKETVESYTLGVHVYAKQDSSQAPFFVWDTKPSLIEAQQNKYIISEFKTPLKMIDSVIFFLYDRKGYTKVIGNRIKLNNLKI